jgi:hypothetical protein
MKLARHSVWLFAVVLVACKDPRAEFVAAHATTLGVRALPLAAWLREHGVSAADRRTIGDQDIGMAGGAAPGRHRTFPDHSLVQ